MTITDALCTNSRRYAAAEPLRPRGVVLHSIGTPQPDARVLRNYWDRNGSQYVVHYMVDDRRILRCMPDDRKCWHVGTPGNDRYLGVEMGEPKEITYVSGAGFTVGDLEKARSYVNSCYKNAVWLLAKLCRQYGWDPFTAVYTHREITRARLSRTDHVDPQHLWDGLGLGIDLLRLRRDVAAAMDTPDAPAAPAGPASAAEVLYRVRRAWSDPRSQIGAYRSLENAKNACPAGYAVFDPAGSQVWPAAEQGSVPCLVTVTASALNVRRGPGTGYPVAMTIPKGGAYTIVEERQGWGRLKSGAGWISLQYTKKI